MAHGHGTAERQRYASALADLWRDLSRTLTTLEQIAGDPTERLDEDALDVLPALQYALHRASELAAGIDPPPGAAATHVELATALAEARDATGEIVEALERGRREAAAALVPEWRGALFRVRLARYRLSLASSGPAERDPAAETEGVPRAALLAAVLVAAGTAAFTGGAVAALWPLWALGLVLVAGGFLAYRP